ncbi:hypothetical protein Tco_0975318 [Tanacetum coccineum]|uniref:Uncharacterized protein n=1 Tax=Tanacetum coccineum TaxID=301880 RepID=A0ABQ5EE61_9ASTR
MPATPSPRSENNTSCTNWASFGGNTRDLGSFRRETDEDYDLHQDFPRSMVLRAVEDDVAGRTVKLCKDILMFQQHHEESLSEAWTLDYAAGDRLRKMSAEKAWATIEELARYEDEGWNDPTISEKGGLNYKKHRLKQLLRIHTNMMPSTTSEHHVGGFEDLMMNLIQDQEEKVKQIDEYMGVIGK